MIDNYKEKFSLCEIVYKIIFDEHQFKKTGEHPQRMQIKMTQVPHALNFAGYTYDKNLLTNLFGGEDRVGCTFRINGAPFPRQRCKRLAPAVRYPFVVTC